MAVLTSVVGFLITLGLIILIHEGGHYLAAKWFASSASPSGWAR